MQRFDEVMVRRSVGWGSGWEYEYGYVKFLYSETPWVRVRVFKSKRFGPSSSTFHVDSVFPIYGPIQAHAGGE